MAHQPRNRVQLERIHRAFVDAGPELRYSYPHRWFPSFADLVLESDDRGESHSYLSSEETFGRLKRFETSQKALKVAVLEKMIFDFGNTAADLVRQIAAEESRTPSYRRRAPPNKSPSAPRVVLSRRPGRVCGRRRL